jgi:murein L,D-transpeptidase YcbB/YkuD
MRILLTVVVLSLFIRAYSQRISNDEIIKYKSWPGYDEIGQFYEANQFMFAWLGKDSLQQDLFKILSGADCVGLNESDYQYEFINEYKVRQPKDLDDSVEIDLRLTDAALHFFRELKIGNKLPSFRYAGYKYSPDGNVITKLRDHLRKQTLNELVAEIQPKSKEYGAMLRKLNRLLDISETPGFMEAKLVSTNVDNTNKSLLLRLYQLGFTDSVDNSITREALVQNVRKAQKEFDVLNDGILRSTTLQAFNISIQKRIEELKIGLNYLRWLEEIKQTGSVLLLNIPSAHFMVYGQGSIILDSKAIVGKKSTPTPTLTSSITEVILYPYWMVPHKIATRELLPLIQKSIGFLQWGNYQVINMQGKVMDPYKINWGTLSPGYFPYIIRQSTGCDNSLGIVKFNFYNPFTVYLHDTPAKGLFAFNKRYFSHGCMRVEKPIELAHLLLGNNSIAIDTLTAKGCINQQAPLSVQVEKRLPVIILYSTVWYNKDGEIKFFDDVYGRLPSK